MSVESGAVKAGEIFLSAFINKITTYVNHIKQCEDNIKELLKGLEKLRGDKDTIDDEVLSGKKDLKKLTPKAEVWLKLVRELVNDESMKRLMNKDMRVAKVMLRLLKNDLKNLVKNDDEIRDLVMKVMKDVAKRNRKAGTSEVSDANNNDKEVSQVLEKLMEETISEFKKLMQDDDEMGIAAMHLLENHKERLNKLTEMDEEVAKIIAKARKMSEEEEIPSDNHDDENGTKDNVDANVDTLRNKVTNLLKPVGDLILSEEVLKTLPEKVRLGVEAMGVVIGNRRGLKAELMDYDDTNSHRNCCGCVISYNYFSDRYYMSLAAETMLVTINEIIGNQPRIEDVIRRKRTDELDDIPTNCVELKSRNKLFGNIIKKLQSNDVNALAVFGMGGSGKTTLATEVANSKAKSLFETTVMVEISESPNIENIQNQIGDRLGLDLNNVHGIHEKATRLYNRLKPEDENSAKQILIVLDNIWKKIDLDQIGLPRKFCKLLLTSRTKDVCKEMDVQEGNILEVGLLSKDEAKLLFEDQVQKEVQKEVAMEYKSVVDRLLKKCRGLPIAIVATATSLKGKELPFWRQFADDLEKPISCQISGVHHETFSILRTSYEVMASEDKKKFFLLACLSPVGSSISIDNLMRYGIGLDLFQHVNKLSEAIDLSRTWAEELVSSSMLLKGDSNEYVKIHDVVRQSTMSFAPKSGINTDGNMFLVDAIPRWICEETFNKYIGISLLAEANFFRLSGVKANLLQILLLKGNANRSSVLESNFFQGMTNLKVLEVLFMDFKKGLPESLCKLKVLKTLHLVECELADIKLIGELGSLLVLSLRGSSLEELPDEIGKLDKLRLLDLSKCQCKEPEPRIPANVIARLSLLEGLYLVGSSFTEWAVKESTSSDTRVSTPAVIEDLTKLDFLNVLEIRIQELVLPICDQFVKNLDKFQIFVGQEDIEVPPYPRALIMDSQFDISEELKKDNSLKALLKKANFLILKSLTVKNIVPELDEDGYRDSSCLALCDIDSISRICEGKAPAGLFHNLCHFDVSNLEKLEVLLPVNPLPRKMTTLEISNCDNLTYIFSEDDGVNKDSDIIQLPCLKKLKVNGVSNLLSVVKESNNEDSRGRPCFFNCKVTLTSLEELSLKYNERIVKLWDLESNLQSFQNLKDLEISNCKEMETIGPPSMFLSLVQLESLTIKCCEKMQQVISDGSETQEIPKEVITFPKLKCLNIEDMENLEWFYGGSYKMAFPCLENLDLSSLKRMTKFAAGITSTTFFPETVQLTSLEELSLYKNKSIVQLWDNEPNLHSFKKLKVLKIKYCEELESIGPPSMFLNLVQLERLTIEYCEKMQQVISDGSETQEIPIEVITFPNLKCLNIEGMKNLECFYGGRYKMAFPCLVNLDLRFVERMTKFAGGITSTSTAFFPETVQLTSLEELWLKCNWGIVQLWDEEPNLHNFQKLKVLEISNCEEMETVGPPSMFLNLVQLESLTIQNCKNLQQVISDGSENQEIPDEVITFPKLKSLNIIFMENLECFYGRSYKMAFPRLENLDLSSLECMTKFAGGINSTAFFPKTIEFPCLEKLYLRQVNDEAQGISSNLRRLTVEKINLPSIVFPSLTYLFIREPVIGDAKFLFSSSSSENEGCVWTYSQLPKLEELTIEGCSNSALQFVKDDGSTSMLNFCGQLKSLKMTSSKWNRLNNIEMTSLHSFTSLRQLHMSRLTSEYLFSVDRGFEQLQSLEKLDIKDCPNMKVIIQGGDNDKAVVFPRLKKLNLESLESMSKFCSISDIPLRFPSLEYLKIYFCDKLESLFCGEPNQVVELPFLEEVSISYCHAMKFFSTRPLELPSLESVRIRYCDAMKSFSTRPLKAVKLRRVSVFKCPAMECFLSANCSVDLLELPSLEDVTISECPKFKSFSPAVLRAPKLQLVEVDDKPYPIANIKDFNHLLESANSSYQTAADKMD